MKCDVYGQIIPAMEDEQSYDKLQSALVEALSKGDRVKTVELLRLMPSIEGDAKRVLADLLERGPGDKDPLFPFFLKFQHQTRGKPVDYFS